MSREKQILTVSLTVPMQVSWGRYSSEDLNILIRDAQKEGGKAFQGYLDGRLQRGHLLEFGERFSEGFKTCILEPALKEGAVQPAKSGPSFVVPRDGMVDSEIRAKLRKVGHSDVFTSPASWLLYFKDEVEKEVRGEKSDLHKGYVLWYVKGEDEEGDSKIFTVRSRWYHREGGVYVHRPDDHGWDAGYCAFSSVADSQDA